LGLDLRLGEDCIDARVQRGGRADGGQKQTADKQPGDNEDQRECKGKCRSLFRAFERIHTRSFGSIDVFAASVPHRRWPEARGMAALFVAARRRTSACSATVALHHRAYTARVAE